MVEVYLAEAVWYEGKEYAPGLIEIPQSLAERLQGTLVRIVPTAKQATDSIEEKETIATDEIVVPKQPAKRTRKEPSGDLKKRVEDQDEED